MESVVVGGRMGEGTKRVWLKEREKYCTTLCIMMLYVN